jgi:recombination protein RecT
MTNNLAVYIHRPEEIQKFQAILGRGANGYVQSVAIAVASSDELQKCTEQSIVNAALRAASLGLSCDPAQREAHLVPRNKKSGDSWVKEASFEVHYLGLYKLAIRTAKYWTINVIPIKKNQEVRMGIDGLHYVYEGNMKIDHFPVDRVTARNIEGVKGWLGYYKTTRGFEKTAYMSVEEIMEHAAKFSKAYQADLKNNTKYSLWSNADLLPTMQMKTVLRDLLKWADTSGDAGAVLQAALEASDEIVDVEAEEVDTEYPPASEFQDELEPQPEPVKEKRLWTVAQKDALIKAGFAKNDFAAKGMLGLSTLPFDATIAEVVAWGEVYRANRVDDKGKANLSAVEAAAIANEQAAP